jgi:hypothetical protein
VISAIAEDRSVILKAKFANPVPEFVGTFGMPNLGKLTTILNIPEYKENATITPTLQNKDGVDVPVGVHFENQAGDFKNDYRYMSAEVVNDKLKSFTMAQVKWGVDFTPSVNGIQRLRLQASANSEETTFTAKTENGSLKFYFGDPANHSGNFTFESNVAGTIAKSWNWPVTVVMNILALSGDKKMRFSDQGAAEIEVDSGLCVYTYIIPAQTK